MKKVLALVVAAAMGLSSAAFAAETATTPAPTAATKAAPAKTIHHKNSIKQRPPRKRKRLKNIIKKQKLNRKHLSKKHRPPKSTAKNTASNNRQNLQHSQPHKFSTAIVARPLAPENYGAKRVTFSTAFSGGYYGGPLSL